MDVEPKKDSVYGLIKQLSEKFASSHNECPTQKHINKLTSIAYEILLSKKIGEQVELNNLENNDDAYCQLLGWQLELAIDYGLEDHAAALGEKGELLYDIMAKDNNNDTSISNILWFLLQLRMVPTKEEPCLSTELKKGNSVFEYFENDRFILPTTITDPNCQCSVFSLGSFDFGHCRCKTDFKASEFFNPFAKTPSKTSLKTSSKTSFNNAPFNQDQPRKKTDKPVDIWALVSKAKFREKKTWEEPGKWNPKVEAPFLSEAGPEASANLHYLYSNRFGNIGGNQPSRVKAVSLPEFIKCLKLLFVGISSSCFQCDKFGNIALNPEVIIKGLSKTALKSYCADIEFSSACYTALDKMSSGGSSMGETCSQGGYIFSEFCTCIKRYLQFYRTAACSISNSSALLHFHKFTRPLRTHLTLLASICKVGPYTESEQIPHGVALLNYLYEKVQCVTDKEVLMVLYAILYPCCQVYFNRFLQRWIFDGVVNDPYTEFFVGANPKYVGTRGRTYWTRSYAVQDDIVPDFLMDLQADILNCGKFMNLLKLCSPNSPLCKYLMGKKNGFLSCCLTSEKLATLEQNASLFYLEASEICGPKFSFSQEVERKKDQEALFLSLVAKKRAATLRRIELENLKQAEEKVRRKEQEIKMLREQYDIAMLNKELRVAQETKKEIEINEAAAKLLHSKKKLVQMEANNIIEYYEKLFEESDRRTASIEDHIIRLKRFHMHGEDGMGKDEIGKDYMGRENELHSKSTSSSDTFLSTTEDVDHLEDIKVEKDRSHFVDSEISLHLEGSSQEIFEDSCSKVHSSRSLDVLNANSVEMTDVEAELTPIVKNLDSARSEEQLSAAEENFRIARKNKEKVLNVEMGFSTYEKAETKKKNKEIPSNLGLTAAQKNKLRVMSSEFGIDVQSVEHTIDNGLSKVKTNTFLNTMESNKEKNMKSDACFYGTLGTENINTIDNENFVNQNEINKNSAHTNSNHKNSTRKISTYKKSTNNVIHNVETIGDYIDLNENKEDKEECVLNKLEGVPDVGIENLDVYLKGNLWKPVNALKPSSLLTLDLKNESPSTLILSRVEPMSIGSTPLSDTMMCSPVDNKLHLNIEKAKFDVLPSCSLAPTASSNFTDDGFNFDYTQQKSLSLFKSELSSALNNSDFDSRFKLGSNIGFNLDSNVGLHTQDSSCAENFLSKRVTKDEANQISNSCQKLFLQESVAIPLMVQLKLANNELLKYFVRDMQYLKHLNSLRNYFFLLDGEFGRNITEGLFERLYDVNFTKDLINCKTLRHLVYKALDSSCKYQENSDCLSFKINDLPKTFNLGDPNVLDCLSLTYQVPWPMNILLPSDTIGKYDEVFKYLLKLHRVSWVLKKIFQELKFLAKESGTKEVYLMMSPQYQRLHQCRHTMTQFMQSLQCFIVGDVLQTSWDIFEKDLTLVDNLDELYSLHTTYIKNILFRCLLNQRSAPIRQIIQNIFMIIFKFYDYLRSQPWDYEDGVYTHPNFKKLEDIFSNFEVFVQYLFKVCRKVANSGYQPHLIQFLDMLDVNNYYSKKILAASSTSSGN